MKNTIKTSIGLALIAAALAGCDVPSASETKYEVVPPELADCKFFKLSSEYLSDKITVARCPNSTTTTIHQYGKLKKSVVVIDGVEYEKRESGK
jgi:hypothetical protein